MESILDVLNVNLSDVIRLPDPEAAEALNARVIAHGHIHALYQNSYAELGIIAREFERRSLWKHVMDLSTGQAFDSLSSWMASNLLACRRTMFAAKKTMEMLEDVEDKSKLLDIPPGNLHVLTQLSSAVKNDPTILEAAKTLPRDKFESKIERDVPMQHMESKKPLRFQFGRSQAKAVESWCNYAIVNGLAATREEAITMACEEAIYEAKRNEQLDKMIVNLEVLDQRY